MQLPIKKFFGNLFLKMPRPQSEKVDLLKSDNNWQTSRSPVNIFDQGAVPNPFEKKEPINGMIQECCQKKTSKIKLVKQHIENNGSIDSWTAITHYRATRLSGIIYILKNTHGMNIESIIDKGKSHFATYVLKDAK